MTIDDRLNRLIELERNASVPPRSADQGWLRLSSAMGQGAAPLDVALNAIRPAAGFGLVVKGAVFAVVVGASGAAAFAHFTASSQRGSASTNGPGNPPSISANVPQTTKIDNSLVAPPIESATERAASPPVRSVRPVSSDARTDSALDKEVALIARAKAELDRGHFQLARASLDRHKAQFPGGMLALEREGLGVLIACGEKRSPTSARLAEQFISQNGQSPLADRIRRSCGIDGNGENRK